MNDDRTYQLLQEPQWRAVPATVENSTSSTDQGILTDEYDGDLFRIWNSLRRLYRAPVAVQRREHAAYLTINGYWTLALDADDIQQLARDISSDAAFMETLDGMLDRCLSLREVREEMRTK